MKKNIPLVDLKKQYQTIKNEVNPVISNIIKNGDFILGKEVAEFEKAYAKFTGVKYAIGVSSGSSALLLSLRVLGIGPGDEVITTPFTFISTLLPILELGARPVLVDIDPKTYQINPGLIEKAITKKTKAILPVHLFGIPAPMPQILKIANNHRLFVVEDACQAHGSNINGKKCGSFGTLSAFSFYPGKNLGAYGDAGAITTNNGLLAKKLTAMRNIGQYKKYYHDIFGYNARLDNLHAGVLLAKLPRLNSWNEKRRNLARFYNNLLSDLPITLPPFLDKGYQENFHLYVIRLKSRDRLLNYLHKNGISASIHYPIPLHLQKCLKNVLGYNKSDFPFAEKCAKEALSLPIFPEMNQKDIIYISKIIRQFFKHI